MTDTSFHGSVVSMVRKFSRDGFCRSGSAAGVALASVVVLAGGCTSSTSGAPTGGSPDVGDAMASGAESGNTGGHPAGGTNVSSSGGTAGRSSGGGSGNGGSRTAGTGGSVSAGGAGAGGASAGGGVTGSGGAGNMGLGIASKYPGDVGIDKDPQVVWAESFEEGTVANLVARYDDSKPAGITLDVDVPAGSAGKASGKLTASGAGPNAVDFFKKLPGYDELFVRYYAKYEANVPWHHTGVWVGGYNPPTNYPNPQAGLKPNGDDRFSVSLEPMEHGAEPRMDFYDYWMNMRSWMDVPTGTTAYYGNSFVHEPSLTAKATWQCIELHIRLNPDPATAAGGELAVWVNDQLVAQFTDTAPVGYWVKDKFCPGAATGTECTQYKPQTPTLVALDLRYRSTEGLKLNVFWPQNYITDTGSGSVFYDDMVLAKSRVGCLR
ncbi:MAG TPA: hypothetical protein VF395_19035 [Polyangiaceae bacterium]